MSTMYENERDYESYDNHPCYCTCKPYNNAPEPGRALLNVGSGGVGPLPIISTPLSRPIPVVSVSIDTSNMCNPKVLLTFTSIISLPIGALVNLNFIVYKTVGDGSPQPIGGTFTFAETAPELLESESFSFQLCDCNPAYDNTTYTVQLEPTSLIAVTAGLTITNAVLSALAVETL
ncbi:MULTISPECIES: DUF4489 domain-containing protein [unclassified Clostridium]|uniref:DUF4489 domain-containing protein n=1 Tax=unclassified Clostridium TaxID=2614128 RepID=UPI0002984F89|nr:MULTISPECIES: DUF4489 domain-containing protein [unclassified Clostridium]EKQ56359.1 MAG: hypothetical protein A370_02115 [Clostridium sp. Maddingley MBC34-26]